MTNIMYNMSPHYYYYDDVLILIALGEFQVTVSVLLSLELIPQANIYFHVSLHIEYIYHYYYDIKL